MCGYCPLAPVQPHAIPSPAWHRRARARRSAARKRVHRARLRGLQPRPADFRLLRAHHSAPRYREDPDLLRSSMGKQDKQAPWKQDQGQGQQRPWSYWRGSWANSPPAKQDKAQMPKYDQMQLKPAAGAEPIPAPRGEEPDSGDLMRAIQRPSPPLGRRTNGFESEREQKEKQ